MTAKSSKPTTLDRGLHARMASLLKNLKHVGYDFSHYSLEHFVQWLEANIANGKKLMLIPQEMVPDEFGGWITSDIAEFFFYEQNTSPIHQEHILLHEISHWLCGHRTKSVSPAVAQAMLQQWPNTAYPTDNQGAIRKRSALQDTQEAEAELLAFLIGDEIARHKKGDGDARFTDFLESMEL